MQFRNMVEPAVKLEAKHFHYLVGFQAEDGVSSVSVPPGETVGISKKLDADAELIFLFLKLNVLNASGERFELYPTVPYSQYINAELIMNSSDARESFTPGINTRVFSGVMVGKTMLRLPYILPRRSIITMKVTNTHPTETLQVWGVGKSFKVE